MYMNFQRAFYIFYIQENLFDDSVFPFIIKDFPESHQCYSIKNFSLNVGIKLVRIKSELIMGSV